MNQRFTVVSVEQALSMSYATLRLAQQGFRVIRIEATPLPGRKTSGDPNRSIGRPVGGNDRHSYYIAPNAGKESLVLDLKQEEGRTLLKHLIEKLDVDVFCTNTMPNRLRSLGIDYDTLAAGKKDLIWCGISAQGAAYPDVPGYDPVLQAMCGYMDLTGYSDGPPLQCGPPIIDLKAGDEAFTQIILALFERSTGGSGKMIDISMARVAVSWLLTFIPMLDMDSSAMEIKRNGNEHRQFIPVNAYPASDGYLFIAIGSDAQWRRLVSHPLFGPLDLDIYATNEGRRANKGKLHRGIEAITSAHPALELGAALKTIEIPYAPITPIEQVADLPFIRKDLIRTTLPSGRKVRLPPAAVDTSYLKSVENIMKIAPGYGENSDAILGEIGYDRTTIADYRSRFIIV